MCSTCSCLLHILTTHVYPFNTSSLEQCPQLHQDWNFESILPLSLNSFLKMAPNFYRISPNCSSRFPLYLITPQGLSLIPSTELFPRGHLKEGPPWHSVLPNLHLLTRFSLPSRKTIPLPATNPAHLFYLPQHILILLHQNEPHSFAF